MRIAARSKLQDANNVLTKAARCSIALRDGKSAIGSNGRIEEMEGIKGNTAIACIEDFNAKARRYGSAKAADGGFPISGYKYAIEICDDSRKSDDFFSTSCFKTLQEVKAFLNDRLNEEISLRRAKRIFAHAPSLDDMAAAARIG